MIWNAVLTIAVAVLSYLYYKDHQPEPVVVASAQAPGKKIVYVNVDSLLTKYEYFKDTRKVLESKRFQLENDLGSRGRSLQNEVAFFQQRAATMTLDQGKATQAALEKKQQDLMAYRERAAQGLAAEEQKTTEGLYNQIFDYLKKYNKQNKYEFVLGYTKGGGILFADNGNDVTQKVLGGLNQEYTQKQTKK